jgi:hypothetical protein
MVSAFVSNVLQTRIGMRFAFADIQVGSSAKTVEVL